MTPTNPIAAELIRIQEPFPSARPRGHNGGRHEIPPTGDDGPEITTATAADLKAVGSALHWEWEGWIARGVLNGVAADAGVGKTRFGMDLARRIYFGLPWPDGAPPTFPNGARSLWIASDHQHAQLVSIAEEFGLPLDAVLLNAPKTEPYGGTCLDDPREVNSLERRIKQEHPALVFIDTSVNATDRGCAKPEDAKAFFVPLMGVAQRTATAIMPFTHLSSSGKELGRRFRAQCRIVIYLTKPNSHEENRRRLWVDKSFALLPKPLGVTMTCASNEYDTSPPEPVCGEPGGKTSARLAEAKAWLTDALTSGPRKVNDLRNEGERRGFGTSTIYAARDHLGVKETEGRPKWWSLPEEDADPDEDAGSDPFS